MITPTGTSQGVTILMMFVGDDTMNLMKDLWIQRVDLSVADDDDEEEGASTVDV